jgi:ubiquinone/menaquinone biosynthesis C-methylase UbiE
MLRRAEAQRRKTNLKVEFIGLPGERIPLPDASVDTIVSTFTLCTIPAVADAVRGLRRVLKPEGRFIFFEHGLAPDDSVQRWQKRAEPLFKFTFEGCHLSRDIPQLIAEGGFRIKELEQGYLAPFPKSPSYCFWGQARRDA